MRLKKIFFIVLAATLGLVACRDDVTEDYTYRGKEYYPLRLGAERFYFLDSVHYSRILNKVSYYKYRVREVIADSFLDQSDKLTYRLEQYISRDTGRSYQFYDLLTTSVDEYGIQRESDNRRQQIMSFPIRNQRSWYPFFYWNDSFQTSTRYQYTAVGKPYSNSWFNFDDCVFVKQRYDSTFIFIRENREIYGKQYGMVYRLKKDLDFQVPNQPDGYVVTWKLYEFYP
jgi:hypothetical protein